MVRLVAVALGLASLLGCQSEDIPQAHKGRMFDKTGALAGYSGGGGFTGPVLGPGTYWTGLYDEIRMVDCATNTKKEPLTSLTKDGVQFGLDIYIRFSADCSDDAVQALLDTLLPADGYTISNDQVYETFIRPSLGEAVREVVSPFPANDLNNKREEILSGIRDRFVELLKSQGKVLVNVEQVNLSNMDFPDEMDHANTDRAVQAVLRDKSIAERERLDAEIQTAERKIELARKEGEVEAARIDQIGAALSRNPQYLQYQLQTQMPAMYEKAGAQGNLVIAAPSPDILVNAKK